MYSIVNILIVLVPLIALAEGRKEVELDNLARSVCSRKGAELTRITQVQALIEQLKSPEAANGETGCSPEQREAILDFLPVLEIADDVCSSELTSRLQNFHFKYMVKDKQQKLWAHLPRSVSEFVIAFGVQTSRICKKNMINSLLLDSFSALEPADLEIMQTITNDKDGLLERMDLKPQNFDDLILAKDLLHGSNAKSTDQPDKLMVRTKTGPKLRETQVACRNRFKPFYDKLIIPLVNLADMGYDYDGEEMKRELNEIRTNKEIGRWYRTVYLCEILLSMEVVDETESNDEGLSKVVRVLSKEEFSKLKAEAGLKYFGDSSKFVEKYPPIVYDYYQKIAHRDQIVDPNEKVLMKAIRSFDRRVVSIKRKMGKLFKRIALTIKDQIKNKNFFIIGRIMNGDLVDDELDHSKVRMNLMSVLDDLTSGKDFEMMKPKIYQFGWWKNLGNIKDFLFFFGFALQIFMLFMMIGGISTMTG